MSENKKRFNFIDLLIIVVIIGAIFVAYTYIDGGNETPFTAPFAAKEKTTVVYKMNFTSKTQNLLDEMQVGDEIFDTAKTLKLGVITDIQITETVDSVYDPEANVYKEVVVPNRYDALITVSAEADVDESGIFIEGYEFHLGKSMFVKGANFVADGVVWEMGGAE